MEVPTLQATLPDKEMTGKAVGIRPEAHTGQTTTARRKATIQRAATGHLGIRRPGEVGMTTRKKKAKEEAKAKGMPVGGTRMIKQQQTIWRKKKKAKKKVRFS